MSVGINSLAIIHMHHDISADLGCFAPVSVCASVCENDSRLRLTRTFNESKNLGLALWSCIWQTQETCRKSHSSLETIFQLKDSSGPLVAEKET